MVMLMGIGGIIALVVVGVVLLLAVALIGWYIKIYNKLVKGRNKVKNSWAQIDVQLKKRFDLIPNMVETVKGYAGHEKDIFEKFAEARKLYSAGAKDGSVSQMAEASSQLSKLVALTVEKYPELKADTHFTQLNNTLKSTEDAIAFSRQFYNDVVLSYNNLREVFPSSIVANARGFKEAELFKVDEEAKDAPKIKF